MNNYFSTYNLNNDATDVQTDRTKYSIFCMILSIVVMLSFYLILLLLPYREESFFYPVGVGILMLFVLQVFLQYEFTKRLKKSTINESIDRLKMLVIRNELNYKWYEFVMPILLYNYIDPLILVSAFSLALILRLAYTFHQLNR